jgi:hypothetical protein
MSERPISPLRQRMLEDMAVRKFGEKTRHDYIRHVEAFASFLGRSPDTATADDVRRYQVHLTKSGVQPPTLNSSASALRFFFGTTLDLGLGDDPSSARAHDRARRRLLPGWDALDRDQTQLLPARAGALQAVRPPDAGEARRSPQGRHAHVLWRACASSFSSTPTALLAQGQGHRSALAAEGIARCMRDPVDLHYPDAERIRVVLDNLSTHSPAALYRALPAPEARRLLRQLEFHYTPKHASWLNMVEIEIGVLRTQCLDRRIECRDKLVSEIAAWQRRRNASGARVKWMFST